MLMTTLLLAASVPAHVAPHGTPMCTAAQFRMTVNSEGFGGMSHDGAELSLHNMGHHCRLQKMPRIEMRNAAGRLVALSEPSSDHSSFRLGAGRRATLMLRWVSNQVFDHNYPVHARRVAVRIGAGRVGARLTAEIIASGRGIASFTQTEAQVAEGMPAG